MMLDQTLHKLLVGVVGVTHHQKQRLVVFNINMLGQYARSERLIQMAVQEIIQCQRTLLAQTLVVPERTFRRGGTTQLDTQQLDAVAVQHGNDVVGKLFEQRTLLGQIKLVDGEHHPTCTVVELFVGEIATVFACAIVFLNKVEIGVTLGNRGVRSFGAVIRECKGNSKPGVWQHG